jgi:hypothetical protein
MWREIEGLSTTVRPFNSLLADTSEGYKRKALSALFD